MMRHSVVDAFDRLDGAIVAFLRAHSLTLVRLALGLVFVWFGALKLAGDSQIDFLATATIGFVPEALLTLGLGAFEVAIGLGLVLGIALRLTLFLFWMHLGGTFLLFVLRPEIAFLGDNPLVLTAWGEFVVKNLVFIAAGLAVGSTVRRRVRR